MDLLIAISQGLGLAVAAGFVAAPPVAFGATAAYYGLDTGALDFAANGLVVAIAWIASAIEVLADAVWPGAQAGAKLVRHAIGGGLAFEFVAGDKLPFVGLAVGALVALAVATALRHVRAGAVKAGGDLRGTAVIEDGAGIVGSSVGLVPFVGLLMTVGAGALVYRARRREQEKYKGLRVLR
jgi:hypothetical protein